MDYNHDYIEEEGLSIHFDGFIFFKYFYYIFFIYLKGLSNYNSTDISEDE